MARVVEVVLVKGKPKVEEAEFSSDEQEGGLAGVQPPCLPSTPLLLIEQNQQAEAQIAANDVEIANMKQIFQSQAAAATAEADQAAAAAATGTKKDAEQRLKCERGQQQVFHAEE